jgi:hypothetical protein
MQLAGSRISASPPGVLGSGFRQLIHRSGPLASGTRSNSPCLDGFSLRENDPHIATALAAGRPRRTRSISTGTPLLPIDATAPKFAFKFGLRGGSLIALIPTASRIPANAAQNFASRSCNRYRQPLRKPTSAKLMFRAICSIQCWSGDVVIPAMHTLRLATRMNVST